MTAITLLLALLAAAYIGSMLMGGRGLRGYGLPSGAEYVLLGIAAGPHGFDAVEPSALEVFEPIVATSAAWLGLVAGLRYGRVGARNIHARRLGAGVVLGVLTALAASASVYGLLSRVAWPSGIERMLVAAGAGVVACETTQHVVQWAVERHGAKGRTCDAFADIAVAGDAVPLLLISAVFAFAPAMAHEVAMPWWVATVMTIPLGMVIGGVAAVLLRVEVTAGEGWGVLLGAALLGTGVAWRLGWSPLTVLFVMGLSLSWFSRHRAELRGMLERTEPAVMLPVLLVAGVQVRLDHPWLVAIVFGAAIVPRIVILIGAGSLLQKSAQAPAGVGVHFGLGLLSTGGLSIVVGLAVKLRYPGIVGDLVLATAVGVTLLGELVGPTSLRRALRRAGEIGAPPSDASTDRAARTELAS